MSGKVQPKRIVVNLKHTMRSNKIRVPILADFSGVSQRTIILARSGAPVTVFLADCIESTIKEKFLK